MKNIIKFLIITGLFLLPVTVFAQSPKKETAKKTKTEYVRFGKALTVSIPPIITLDSQLANDFSSRQIINNVQQGLYAFDPNQKLIPALAADFPRPDGDSSFIIPLKIGIFFHDGTEFNAESVVFTINRLLNPATGAPLRAYFAGLIKSAEAIDNYTVRINLNSPYVNIGMLLARMETYPLSPKTVGQYGKAYGKATITGTGPFSFFELKRGEKLILKKFANYWEIAPNKDPAKIEKLPYLNLLQFKFHTQEEAVIPDLQVNRVYMMGGVNPATCGLVTSRHVKTLSRPGLLLEQIYLNITNAPLNNKNLRLALAYGVDRGEIVSEIFKGHAQPALSCLPSWHWAHNPAYAGVDYQPLLAAKLLKDAGFTETNPLKVELLCTAQEPFLSESKLIAKLWKDIGIKVKVTPVSKKELLGRLYGRQGYQRNFNVALEDWEGGINPDQFIFDLYSAGSAYNKVQYNNPYIESLRNNLRAVQSPEERVSIYHQAEKIITEDAGTIYLVYPNNIWLMNKYIQGVNVDFDGLISFTQVWIP